MRVASRALGQTSTATPPFACPSGYTYSNPDNTVIPNPVPASELAQLQGAFCVSSSGTFYQGAETMPITIAIAAAAVAAALFLPGLWKLLALPLGYEAYTGYRCGQSGNTAPGCIVSL